MLDWIVGKLKWFFVLCLVAGPIVSFSCWQDGNRRREVAANGTTAVARIEGATRVKRRRSGTSFKLDLSWTDESGAPRTAGDVPVSSAFARRIITDDRLVADSLAIKYVAAQAKGDGSSDARDDLVILDDTAEHEKTDEELVYVGAGAGVLGAIGSAFFFLPRRRQVSTA